MKPSISGIITLLTIATVSKLFYFYLFFDINIFVFLQADEILMNIIYSLPFSIAFFILLVIGYRVKTSASWMEKKFPRIYKFEREVISMLLVILFLFTFMLIGCYVQKEKVIEYNLVQQILIYHTLFILVVLAFLIIYIIFRLKDNGNSFTTSLCNYNSARLFSITIAIITLMCSLTLTEVARAKSNVLFLDVKFELNNGTKVTCSKNLSCIGITKNFIFLYDNTKGVPKIYNISEISSIQTKYSLNSAIK